MSLNYFDLLFLDFGEGLILLDSVGTFINVETLDTHPSDHKGQPILDESECVPLDETSDDWRSSLSERDSATVKHLAARGPVAATGGGEA